MSEKGDAYKYLDGNCTKEDVEWFNERNKLL